MKILLFDVDGTLIMTGGAGSRAMTRALKTLFDIENGLNGVTLSGMTDPVIFHNACRKAGIEPTAEQHEYFKRLYLTYLREEIERPHPQKQMLPGVRPLLERLRRHPGVYLGLLTGNYREGAEVKLGHFDLFHYFRFGAFGDDHAERDKLVPIAVQRFEELVGQKPEASEVWVIGDTPRDVACARPHGARTLAVATGEYSAHDLQQAGADVVLPDLSDVDRVLAELEKK